MAICFFTGTWKAVSQLWKEFEWKWEKNTHRKQTQRAKQTVKEYDSQFVMKKIAEEESSCQNKRMKDAMLDISNGHFLYSWYHT